MIKGALALALMSTVGMGGVVTVSSDGDMTASYFVPPVVVAHNAPKPHIHHRPAPKPVVYKNAKHHSHKPQIKKDHKPNQPSKAKQGDKPKGKDKAPAKKGNSKGGKR